MTTPRQRRVALARPFLGVALFVALWVLGLGWSTPLAVFLLFVAVVDVAHDVVHGSLGLRASTADWALFAVGAVVLESGHAYRASHARHHAVFPGPDDPEGDPARMSSLGAVLHGPLFLPRLWWWARRRARPRSRERRWLDVEAAWAVAVLGASAALLPVTAGPLAFTAQVVAGSWVYPLLTVHLPHHDYGNTPWTQTHTLRGRIVPALFLELTYHLEHHLYPEVPSHKLPELARRLDPVLRRAGVQPRRVP